MIGPALALRITALSGALAVGLGAFGAHALKETLVQHARTGTWDTAVLYHLVHTAVMLALMLQPSARRLVGPWICFALGTLIFSGSLYVLCLTNFTKLGMITPIGGLSFIAGWLWLAIAGAKTLKAEPGR